MHFSEVSLSNRADEHLRAWGLAVLRAVVGAVFLVHGAQKVFDLGIGGVANVFANLQIPQPLISALVVTVVEVTGGVAMCLGLFSRSAAALLAADMLVASVLTYLKPAFFVKAGPELPITLLAACIAILLAGPGAASLDRAIRNHR